MPFPAASPASQFQAAASSVLPSQSQLFAAVLWAAGLALAGAGVGVGVTNFGDKSVVRRLSESVPVLLSPKFEGVRASRAGRSATVLFPAASPASQFPVASSALPFPALLLGLLRAAGWLRAGVGVGATNFGDKSVVWVRTELVPALLSPKFEGRGGNAAAIPRLPAVGVGA